MLSLLAAVLLAVGAGQAAHAQYAQSVTVVFNGDGTITVTLDNCIEGETVTFEFNGATATDVCENGTASVVFGLTGSGGPATGVLSGSVIGSTSQDPQTFTVDMTPANETLSFSSGVLPATGSTGLDTSMTMALGLLVVGSSMLVVAQLRRRSGTTA